MLPFVRKDLSCVSDQTKLKIQKKKRKKKKDTIKAEETIAAAAVISTSILAEYHGYKSFMGPAKTYRLNHCTVRFDIYMRIQLLEQRTIILSFSFSFNQTQEYQLA